MGDLFLFLNQPTVLWSLLIASIVLVLIDYLFPVDWPAYIGYALFSVFINAIVPLSPAESLVSMIVCFVFILVLHEFIFARFLTNAPKYENNVVESGNQINESEDASEGGKSANI